MKYSASQTPGPFLVVGAGRFGSRAVHALLKRSKDAEIVVVDRDPKALASLKGLSVLLIQAEALSILGCLMESPSAPQWVIPAVPIHLAFHWILQRLRERHPARALPVPEGMELPHAFRGQDGTLYCSLADFVCPAHCVEPKDACTVTGRKRAMPMFELIGQRKPPGFSCLVIRSEQMAPGVGGYRSRRLRESIQEIDRMAKPVLIGTACRCHGVINALDY